ncbi:hypothetical protein MRX96_008855 [Rhipicephalus microplus]
MRWSFSCIGSATTGTVANAEKVGIGVRRLCVCSRGGKEEDEGKMLQNRRRGNSLSSHGGCALGLDLYGENSAIALGTPDRFFPCGASGGQ